MNDALVPTTDFSPAKSHLSDVMTQVFHWHQPQLVWRHRRKEQMLLMRPDDLVAMLADQHLEVLVVHDGDEVTLRVPEMGVLGFGGRAEAYLAGFTAVDLEFVGPPIRLVRGRNSPDRVILSVVLVGNDAPTLSRGDPGSACEHEEPDVRRPATRPGGRRLRHAFSDGRLPSNVRKARMLGDRDAG